MFLLPLVTTAMVVNSLLLVRTAGYITDHAIHAAGGDGMVAPATTEFGSGL